MRVCLSGNAARAYALLVGACVMPSSALAARYSVDPETAELRYTVQNMVGVFRDYQADLTVEPSDLSASSLTVTVPVASADMDNALFNRYLTNRAFFDAGRHPQARFVSRSVTPKPPDQLQVSGELTLKGVTQPVTMTVTVDAPNGLAAFESAEPVAIHGVAEVQRSAFGIDWELDEVADRVTIEIEGRIKPD